MSNSVISHNNSLGDTVTCCYIVNSQWWLGWPSSQSVGTVLLRGLLLPIILLLLLITLGNVGQTDRQTERQRGRVSPLTCLRSSIYSSQAFDWDSIERFRNSRNVCSTECRHSAASRGRCSIGLIQSMAEQAARRRRNRQQCQYKWGWGLRIPKYANNTNCTMGNISGMALGCLAVTQILSMQDNKRIGIVVGEFSVIISTLTLIRWILNT